MCFGTAARKRKLSLIPLEAPKKYSPQRTAKQPLSDDSVSKTFRNGDMFSEISANVPFGFRCIIPSFARERRVTRFARDSTSHLSEKVFISPTLLRRGESRLSGEWRFAMEDYLFAVVRLLLHGWKRRDTDFTAVRYDPNACEVARGFDSTGFF